VSRAAADEVFSTTKTPRFDFQLTKVVVKRLQAVRLKLVEHDKNLQPSE
jgi:hypothetical protein